MSSFLTRVRDQGVNKVLGADNIFKFQESTEIVKPDLGSGTVYASVGEDNQRNNISLRYNSTEAGIYRNNPPVPIVKILPDNTVEIDNIVIDNIASDTIEVNQISTLDTGAVQVNDYTVLKDQLKVSNIVGGTIINTSGADIHIQSDGEPSLLLESTGVQPVNIGGVVNGTKGFGISQRVDGNFVFISGDSASDLLGNFQFFSGLAVLTPGELPTFSSVVPIYEASPTRIFSYVPLVMDTENISGWSNLISATNGRIFIQNSPAQVQATTCQLHIANTGGSILYIEADTDNTSGSDVPQIIMSQDNKNVGLRITNSDGSVNPYFADTHYFDYANNAQANAGLLFRSLQITPTASGLTPGFSNPINTFYLGNSSVQTFVPLQLNNNTLSGATQITSNTYRLSTTTGRVAEYSLTAVPVSGATDTLLALWDVVSTSTDVTFNDVTGVFNPGNGVYKITFQAIDTGGLNTNMSVRMQDDLGGIKMEEAVTSNDSLLAVTGATASQYTTIVDTFNSLRTYRFFVRYSLAGAMDYNLRIMRLF